MNHTAPRKYLDLLVLLFVVALIVENFVLLRQNRDLKNNPPLPAAFAVHRTEPLENLGGIGFDGRFHAIDLPQTPGDHLLLFTFAPGCPECQLGEPYVASLSAKAKKLGWRTVFVSRGNAEGTRSYCDNNNIPLEETLMEPPYPTYLKLGLAAVPQVVAVGAKGRVEGVWVGRLTQDSEKAAAQFLAEHSKPPDGVQARSSTAPQM